MRSHLVAILIAGLVLLPSVRLTPLGMPAGELDARCATCVHDHELDAPEPDSCCGDDAEEAPEDSPCRDCPPLCCLVGPAIAVAPALESDDDFPARPRAVMERPRDEHTSSRSLAPDPPVPIA